MIPITLRVFQSFQHQYADTSPGTKPFALSSKVADSMRACCPPYRHVWKIAPCSGLPRHQPGQQIFLCAKVPERPCEWPRAKTNRQYPVQSWALQVRKYEILAGMIELVPQNNWGAAASADSHNHRLHSPDNTDIPPETWVVILASSNAFSIPVTPRRCGSCTLPLAA